MTIEDFIAAQLQVIRDGDLGEYLPTLWVETPSQVSVNLLTDDLEEHEIETAARQWAQQEAGKHDYFLAFRTDESHIKVVTRIGTTASECRVAIE